jgi:hypothetical protein
MLSESFASFGLFRENSCCNADGCDEEQKEKKDSHLSPQSGHRQNDLETTFPPPSPPLSSAFRELSRRIE